MATNQKSLMKKMMRRSYMSWPPFLMERRQTSAVKLNAIKEVRSTSPTQMKRRLMVVSRRMHSVIRKTSLKTSGLSFGLGVHSVRIGWFSRADYSLFMVQEE